MGSVSGPKTGAVFVGEIEAAGAKIEKVSIVSAGARQRFCTPLGVPWFCSAASTCSLVLHTLRTFMSTHVLELGRPSVARPVLLVFLDPKMKATNSPGNAIYLWTHQWPNPRPSLVKNG